MTIHMTALGVEDERRLGDPYAEWPDGSSPIWIAYTGTQVTEFGAPDVGTVFHTPISITGDQ